jgi:hypothetical protein
MTRAIRILTGQEPHPRLGDPWLWRLEPIVTTLSNDVPGQRLLSMLAKRCKCSSSVGMWGLTVASNGAHRAQLRCLYCGKLDRTIGAKRIAASLPVWSDNTDPRPCERCGGEGGVEDHHWAPRHLFADENYWPIGPLCVTCHHEWHARMTPFKSKGGAAEADFGGTPLRLKWVKGWRWNHELGCLEHRPYQCWTRPHHWACQHCNGADFVQTHSWAPEDVFEDSWAWPTTRLCRRCSTFWNDVMEKARASRVAA